MPDNPKEQTPAVAAASPDLLRRADAASESRIIVYANAPRIHAKKLGREWEVSFPYCAEAVPVMRALPYSHFDSTRGWVINYNQDVNVVEAMDRVLEILRANGIDLGGAPAQRRAFHVPAKGSAQIGDTLEMEGKAYLVEGVSKPFTARRQYLGASEAHLSGKKVVKLRCREMSPEAARDQSIADEPARQIEELAGPVW